LIADKDKKNYLCIHKFSNKSLLIYFRKILLTIIIIIVNNNNNKTLKNIFFKILL